MQVISPQSLDTDVQRPFYSVAIVALLPCQATSHYLNQWWLAYWRIDASLGLNELSNYAHHNYIMYFGQENYCAIMLLQPILHIHIWISIRFIFILYHISPLVLMRLEMSNTVLRFFFIWLDDKCKKYTFAKDKLDFVFLTDTKNIKHKYMYVFYHWYMWYSPLEDADNDTFACTIAGP